MQAITFNNNYNLIKNSSHASGLMYLNTFYSQWKHETLTNKYFERLYKHPNRFLIKAGAFNTFNFQIPFLRKNHFVESSIYVYLSPNVKNALMHLSQIIFYAYYKCCWVLNRITTHYIYSSKTSLDVFFIQNILKGHNAM